MAWLERFFTSVAYIFKGIVCEIAGSSESTAFTIALMIVRIKTSGWTRSRADGRQLCGARLYVLCPSIEA
jgi:hypothetical protein